MNEKFFMPEFECSDGINQWKKFNKQVNGDSFKEYDRPIKSFVFHNERDERINEVINKESSVDGNLIIAIVESEKYINVFTIDENKKINSHKIYEYERDSVGFFERI